MTDSALKVTVSPATEKLLKRMAANVDNFSEIMFRVLQKLSTQTAGFVIKDSLSGKRLNRRTGALARSTTGLAVKRGGLPEVQIGVFRGPAVAYAGIQEVGGTIRPVSAKALAIPQEPALTGAGVDRFGGPRNTPFELRFIPFRNSGLAVGKLVKEEEAQQLQQAGIPASLADTVYLLVESVEIPPSGWLSEAVITFLPQFSALLAEAIAEVALGNEPSGN